MSVRRGFPWTAFAAGLAVVVPIATGSAAELSIVAHVIPAARCAALAGAYRCTVDGPLATARWSSATASASIASAGPVDVTPHWAGARRQTLITATSANHQEVRVLIVEP